VAVILLPSLLAREAGGEGRFEIEAPTVREALRELPVRDLLFDERGELRPLVNVYVDSVQADDLEAPLEHGTEIRLVAAVAGGSLDFFPR
jgi:molybdopterin converting factor small subunit